MLPKQEKIMKLTSMKNFVFLSSLKHIHKSDVRGPSPENLFLVNKVALTTGTGEAKQSISTRTHSQPSSSGCLSGRVVSCCEFTYDRVDTEDEKINSRCKDTGKTVVDSVQMV